MVRYDSVELSRLARRVVYTFAKDKLVLAKRLFDVEHNKENGFIDRFARLAVSLEGLENEVRSHTSGRF